MTKFMLLIFIAVTSIGCSKTQATGGVCGDLSQTFQEMAGDTFDRFQSLETQELEGEIYYKSAEQEADRAVLKAERLASSDGEKTLANALAVYFKSTQLYRETTKLIHSVTDEPDWEKHPWRVAYRDKYLPTLSDAEKSQLRYKTLISSCVMHSKP